ncbi:succinylglutamate-semialdehyde dehydrogenase [Acinetobacter variabilis]|jgi:succinylglutamic semialdehyde dehydrogenase|nr:MULTISPECIES: succinylglutamate-semialdehyde dehydrogenase [Pseudomonadota]ODN53907.1 succinylglutamate-semialdehyde dehydrogenase [Acinetobacter sp. 51m]AUC06554.1 succinylglutamate-semialdehyde dehydrogenase [Acinetobacter lwoffii]MCU4313008.1 succinylglutamate-semialdehyde dehydrogenase [Acinetobacter variabilis]MCU4451058.1 succinylglutamate-semialdehyde dehydrogenase [Acinetobacter lwoffii]MCU4615486.1 succinylglutamate-semialdehyde dehydrogenase [Acinetobacter lwoffii]
MSLGSVFIQGQWRAAQGQPFVKTNPVGKAQIWAGQEATAEDVQLASESARQAFPQWAVTPLEQRIQIVEEFARLLKENQQHLAEVISQETSKPLWETLTEVQAMIGKAAISIRAYQQRTGESSTDMPDGKATLRHRPHGVLAVFGPYNFPGHLPNGHIIPALLAGNCILFKPSELTPWTAEETLKLWQKAGLPNGVINLLQGGRSTGEALASATDVDGILFTGSANTGYHLHKLIAGQPEKILALEMGGNNALIVDDVSDIDAAVHLAIQSAFVSAGQRCTCARRIIVKQGAVGDQFIQRFVEVAKNLKIGAWNDHDQPFMGGVISSQAAQSLLEAQQKLLALGATPLAEMQLLAADSTLLSAGILDVSKVTDIPDEEYFGPLTKIYRYQDFDEALKLANQTRFGLAVGLISPDRELYERLLISARAGIVNWNKPLTGASSAAPFGGIGASGNHRPSAFYAADYCAWPMASLETETIELPEKLSPGISF